jgi:hypothetical protein
VKRDTLLFSRNCKWIAQLAIARHENLNRESSPSTQSRGIDKVAWSFKREQPSRK